VSAGRTYPTSVEQPSPEPRPSRARLVALLRRGYCLMPEDMLVFAATSIRKRWLEDVRAALEAEKRAEVFEADEARAIDARDIAAMREQGGEPVDVGSMDAFGRRFGVKVLRPGGAR
jgi:hypothetical protein